MKASRDNENAQETGNRVPSFAEVPAAVNAEGNADAKLPEAGALVGINGVCDGKTTSAGIADDALANDSIAKKPRR